MTVQLTKTDFTQYLKCPKSLWLLKREPSTNPCVEISVAEQRRKREGDEFEQQYVHKYFESLDGRTVEFQRGFKTANGLYARADVFETTDDGETILYEVKSSTSVKDNHIKDACFQKICAELSGQEVNSVCIVHINGEYVRDGEIDLAELLECVDVTEVVGAGLEETKAEISEALKLLAKPDINRDGCDCIYKSRRHHCDTFALFNPEVPEQSIYSLPRIGSSKNKLRELADNQVFGLRAIPDDYPLSARQRKVLFATKTGKPQINADKIREFLSGIDFPLYFLDYETFSSAVPSLNGIKPHQKFPVQYSLHILEADGQLTHRESLERKLCLPERLIERMEVDIGPEGSIVAWGAAFEKAQNCAMGELFPDKADFLSGLNSRIVDLEVVFKKGRYVDARFDGSTSIKKVLPVICPELSYENLEIQDGEAATALWHKMINAEESESDRIARNLLRYCKLDTLAMVKIYQFLRQLVTESP